MTGPAYEPLSRFERAWHHQPRRGAACLQRAIINVFDVKGAVDLGVCASPLHDKTNPKSLHHACRAGDVGSKRLVLLKEISLRLVANATDFGVCEVICDDHRWTGDRGVEAYHGPDRHRTHLHWGQTRGAADTKADPVTLIALFEFILRKT